MTHLRKFSEDARGCQLTERRVGGDGRFAARVVSAGPARGISLYEPAGLIWVFQELWSSGQRIKAPVLARRTNLPLKIP